MYAKSACLSTQNINIIIISMMIVVYDTT